jgi:GT2 family glycosyltransferase
VLGLLAWNTKAITLEPASTHFEEASLLKRLGHEVLVCICDNGSSDGTSEALKQLAAQNDVSSTILENTENRGNSIGRNQIIDVALSAEADYFLFTDGDIEIVPFPTVAMIQYMEDPGHTLACVGPVSNRCSPERRRCSRVLRSVQTAEPEDSVAWTQYGMFRCEIFRQGLRFDVNHHSMALGGGSRI